jgi:hypothetical protein
MAGLTRTKLQREHDCRKAAELTLRGLTAYEIADLPEFRYVSRRQICDDC